MKKAEKTVTYGPPKHLFRESGYDVWVREPVMGKTELDHIIKQRGYKRAGNHDCWALCTKQGNGRWHVRRIVWGILMARTEKRPGETIRRAAILLMDEK